MKYDEVIIRKDVPKTEYLPDERRAHIYELICKHGHRSLLNKRKLAEEFGISPSMITKDLDAIDEEIAKDITPAKRNEYLATWKMLLKQAIKNGDARLAMDIQKSLSTYITPQDNKEENSKEVVLQLVWDKKKEEE